MSRNTIISKVLNLHQCARRCHWVAPGSLSSGGQDVVLGSDNDEGKASVKMSSGGMGWG